MNEYLSISPAKCVNLRAGKPSGSQDRCPSRHDEYG